jgi:hypothetical protein
MENTSFPGFTVVKLHSTVTIDEQCIVMQRPRNGCRKVQFFYYLLLYIYIYIKLNNCLIIRLFWQPMSPKVQLQYQM